MSFTVADLPDFLNLLRQHPEWRDAVRDELSGEWQRRIDASIERMIALLEQADSRHFAMRQETAAEFAAMRQETAAEFAAMRRETNQRFERLEGIIADLARATNERFGKVEGRLGNIEGKWFEHTYRAIPRLSRYFRKPVEIFMGDLDEMYDGRDDGTITVAEFEQVGSLDFIFRCRDGRNVDAPIVYAALEVSRTIHGGDIRRAAERAAILRRVGIPARAFAGGQAAAPEMLVYADSLGVTLMIDKEQRDADETDEAA